MYISLHLQGSSLENQSEVLNSNYSQYLQILFEKINKCFQLICHLGNDSH